MNYSKKEVVDAILFFAELYNQKVNYQALLHSCTSFPKIVEMIVYDMFIEGFDYSTTDINGEEYKNYIILLLYCRELRQEGFVKFK